MNLEVDKHWIIICSLGLAFTTCLVVGVVEIV